ncbi:MFS transporter [Salinisphaera orenii MK-B5]|uniref:MFS transporter n=1 Tax=Salinisphaera orenii MK-B5 TaxID=856730 RepID=A0A423PTB4_9GAMM|nr:MFS transporter [Salinisphaera orenii]ROO28856.1 MFS transporter [Salinisphaera orenii MK-B5]
MSQTPTNPLFVLIALATGGFAIGTTEFATMSLLPFIQASLDIDPSTASHIISAYALGVVFGAPVITVLGARMARKPLLLILMLLFAAGNALSALAPNYGWLVCFRFLSGLPHGAYFGLASLVAADVVAPARRTQAVGYVMLGLTAATIVGVPLATWLGGLAGWRPGYWVIAALALLAAALILLFAPHDRAAAQASPLRELGALARPAVWLTLAIGAIGFGGMFSVYTYLTATLDAVTGVGQRWMPPVLAIFGVGMTLGNIVLPRLADRALMPTAGGLLVWSALALAAFPLVAGNVWLLSVDVFCIGIGGALGTVLQTRLMDVAGDAQNLAAALNHVAFNTANALGPWLAGLALAAGFGLRSTGIVGCVLALGGLAIWAIAWRAGRRPGPIAPD